MYIKTSSAPSVGPLRRTRQVSSRSCGQTQKRANYAQANKPHPLHQQLAQYSILSPNNLHLPHSPGNSGMFKQFWLMVCGVIGGLTLVLPSPALCDASELVMLLPQFTKSLPLFLQPGLQLQHQHLRHNKRSDLFTYFHKDVDNRFTLAHLCIHLLPLDLSECHRGKVHSV